MANPVRAAYDWLRGRDLQAIAPPAPAAAPEQVKLYYWNDVGAALRAGMLVHGPGASELLGQAQGYGHDANSAVFACLTALATGFIEAPPRVYRHTAAAGKDEPRPTHPLQLLLDAPNPALSAPELWWWVQWAKHVHGNAYLRKLRAGDPLTGNVVELWPVSPTRIAPHTTADQRRRGVFVGSYRYEYETGKYEDIPPENIVHFRLGIDDYDHRLGCSPLRRLVREVSTDDEATRFADALLHNYAIPGLIVVTQDPEMTEAQAEAIKAAIGEKFGADRRGQVGVLNNGADVRQFGFSPEQMNLQGLHRLPEERVCAVLRVPPIIAHLGAGLDRSTYANYREAREAFAEQTLMPLYQFDAATLNARLRPDFDSDPRTFVRFDTSELRAFQEDEDKKYARLNVAVQGRWLTPNEARSEVGLPPLPDGDAVAAPPMLPAPRERSREQDDGNNEDRRATATEVQRRGLSAATGKAALTPSPLSVAHFPALFDAMLDLAEPGLRRDLASYFEGQHQRVRRRILEAGA